MSMSKQLQKFDLNFVKDAMREWNNLAQDYENSTQKVYRKLRSYLTLYQFRLNDQEKSDIREMLSQELDEIEKINFIEDMDNYLDGFCFQLDKSIIPKKQPTEVKIKIAPEPKSTETISDIANSFSNYKPEPPIYSDLTSTHTQSQSPLYHSSEIYSNSETSFSTTDACDIDIYQMMFLQ